MPGRVRRRVCPVPVAPAPTEGGSCATQFADPKLERALGRWDALNARVRLHGLAQRTGQSLELHLDDVVRIAPRKQLDVQRNRGVVRNRFEYVARERAGEVAPNEVKFLARGLTAVHEVGTPRQIDGGLGQRLIHRNQGLAVPGDASFIAQRLLERLPKHDRGVFDRVVDINIDVTSGAHLQINERVLAERRQHVVIEGNRGRNIGFTRPIEIKLDRDGRLGCGPLNLGGSLPCHASNTSTRARLNALISSGVPIDTRSHPAGPVSRIKTPRSNKPCHTSCRAGNFPKYTKFASEAAISSPRSCSQATVASRSARNCATEASSSLLWRSAVRATAWVTADR